MHGWSLSLSRNYRVFIRGCFAVLVLGPGASVMPKATQTLSRAALLRLAAGRSPRSKSSGQSHQTHLRWRAVCSRRGLDVVIKWLRSPMNSPGEVILQCPGSLLHSLCLAASSNGWQGVAQRGCVMLQPFAVTRAFHGGSEGGPPVPFPGCAAPPAGSWPAHGCSP